MSFKTTFTLSEVYNKQLSGIWPTAFYDYFEKTSVLIGTNETTFITDASTNNWALTPLASVNLLKAKNEHPYQPGYYSTYFATSSAYLTAPSNAALAFGTGQFTIEGWFYWTGTPSGTIVGMPVNGGLQWYAASGTLGLNIYNTGNVTAATLPSLNAWHHIAMTRDSSNVCTIWIDGINSGSASSTASFPQSTWYIYGGGSGGSAGYVSNFRVLKGTALYTANFIPSTVPLTAIQNTVLLACMDSYHAERITPNSITATGVPSIRSFTPFSSSIPTAYSSYGSANINNASLNNTAFTGANFGTSADFTIESWMKWDATTASNHTSYEFNGTTRTIIGRSSTGLRLYLTGTEKGFAYTFIPNVWYHIAVVRSLLTYYVYINGVLATTAFTLAGNHSYTTLTIGRNYDTAEIAVGLSLSDFRIVNGTAVYGGNFIPPTAPLTAIRDTTLLTFQNDKEIANSTFYDDSSMKNLLTTSGTPTQGTFSPISANGWSTYLNSSGYLQTAAYDVACTGNFTFECWAYITTYGSTSAFFTIGSEASGRHYFAVQNSGQPWTNTYGGSSYTWGTSTSVPLNAWTHIAWVRIGSTVTCYVNGISIGTNSISATIGNSGGVYIGTNPSGGYLWTGYLSDVRLVNGTALYTSNFLPPTKALTAVPGTMLLTCQDNRFKDNSVNAIGFTVTSTPSVQPFSPYYPSQKTIGTTVDYVGNSTYFNGSTDYLTVASNSVFAFNTSDFTIEFWINPTSSARQDWVDFNTTGTRLLIYTSSGSIIYHNGGSAITSGTTYTQNVWQHIALVRISGSTKLYLNGVQTGSTYADTSNYSAQGLSIGKDAAGSTYITGFMSNLRMVKGTGVYTAAFTPPTAPLTAIPGTSLLTCQDSLFTDNSGNALTITRNGSPKISPVTPFTTTTSTSYDIIDNGSMYFNGTNDYVGIPSSPSIGMGTFDFTVEGWIYPTASSQFTMIAMTGNSIQIFISGGTLYWYNSAIGQVSGGTIVLNTWQHIAFSRNNGVVRGFLNGVQVISVATATDFAAGTAEIGRNGTNNGGSFGYISSVRIVKGTALYIAPFTPSTVLRDVPGTVLLVKGNNSGIYDATGRNNLITNGDTKLRSNIKKYGNNSMYFDGTGDYMVVPNNPLFALSGGSYTIEFWINWAAIGGDSFVLDRFSYGSGPGYVLYTQTANNTFMLYASGIVIQSATAFVINTWYHFAITYDGTNTRMFVNGTLDATSTSNITNAELPLTIGARNGGSAPSNFYMDDFRITKGVARYITSFTPPPRLGLVP